MMIAQKPRKKYEVKSVFKRHKPADNDLAKSQSQPQNKGNAQQSKSVEYTDAEGLLRVGTIKKTG